MWSPKLAHVSGGILMLMITITAFGAGRPEMPLRAERRGHARARRILSVTLLMLGALGLTAQARLLFDQQAIRHAIASFRSFGERRETFIRRATLPAMLLDCTNDPHEALSAPTLIWLPNAVEPTVEAQTRAAWPEQELLGTSHDGTAPYALNVAFSTSAVRDLWSATAPATSTRLTLCRRAMLRTSAILRRIGLRATVLVEQPSTGRILVWADYNPDVDSLRRLLALEVRPLGSTAKLYLMAAAAATTGWDVPISCPARLRIDGRDLHNAHGEAYSAGDPVKMLELSCNSGAVELMEHVIAQIGTDSLARLYDRMGIAPASAVSLTARDTAFWSSNARAIRQTLAPPVATMPLDRETTAWNRAMMAIGQGQMRASALDLLQFTAAIANDGGRIAPTFEWVRGDAATSRPIMTPDVARRLRAAMRRVVTRGTAHRLRGGAVESLSGGYIWAGKTGTAQRSDVRQREHGIFSGMVCESAPCEQPLFAIVVYIDGAGAGGDIPTTTADSVAASLLENYGAILSSRASAPAGASRLAGRP